MITKDQEPETTLKFADEVTAPDTTTFIEELLRGILDGTKSGVYHGGSLVVGQAGQGFVVNISNEKTPVVIRRLAAKIYLKTKNWKCSYWELAQKLCQESE